MKIILLIGIIFSFFSVTLGASAEITIISDQKTIEDGYVRDNGIHFTVGEFPYNYCYKLYFPDGIAVFDLNGYLEPDDSTLVYVRKTFDSDKALTTKIEESEFRSLNESLSTMISQSFCQKSTWVREYYFMGTYLKPVSYGWNGQYVRDKILKHCHYQGSNQYFSSFKSYPSPVLYILKKSDKINIYIGDGSRYLKLICSISPEIVQELNDANENENETETGNEAVNEIENEDESEAVNEIENEDESEAVNETGNEDESEAVNEIENEDESETVNENENEDESETVNETGNESEDETGNEIENESEDETGNENDHESFVDFEDVIEEAVTDHQKAPANEDAVDQEDSDDAYESSSDDEIDTDDKEQETKFTFSDKDSVGKENEETQKPAYHRTESQTTREFKKEELFSYISILALLIILPILQPFIYYAKFKKTNSATFQKNKQ